MRICILGGDGYLGWPTAMYFAARGHRVLVIDNCVKRRWEAEKAVRPLIALPAMADRVRTWNRVAFKHGFAPIEAGDIDIAGDYAALHTALVEFQPDTIVHYAEQPSAPFSMASRENAVETQQNNIIGTLNLMFAMHEALPDTHLVKLGTLGEYGTPNVDIEEGWLDLEHNGRRDRVLFPKKPGSIYHLSKVHDSANLEFACRVYKLRVTDLNQGVVYGIETDETVLADGLHTCFHYDAVFGTVLNRFIVQAVLGVPLSVYGSGSQCRGFLNIRDTLRCVELATLEPAAAGEFRVFNQLTEQFSILDLASRVQAVGQGMGLDVRIDHLVNPRVEAESHYYNVRHSGLLQLGLSPHFLTDSVLQGMIRTAMRHAQDVDRDSLQPSIVWQTGARKAVQEHADPAGRHDRPEPMRLVG